MEYFKAYQYIFSSPKWAMNLLAGSVAVLVPIVGPMVLLGYEFDIIEAMHLHGEDRYPDFDFDRLMDYLMRGLWVFLVALVVGMVVMLPLVLLALVGFVGFLFIAIVPQTPRPGATPEFPLGLFLAGYAGLIGTMFVIEFLGWIVVTPFVIRAGLTQDFKEAFSWSWIRDFFSRMWGTLILAAAFLTVSRIVLIFLGLLCCVVGTYPAMALLQYAQGHLWHQLYEIYLQRGGTPIPLKVQDAGRVPVDEASE
jgi:hypothetical protein